MTNKAANATDKHSKKKQVNGEFVNPNTVLQCIYSEKFH